MKTNQRLRLLSAPRFILYFLMCLLVLFNLPVADAQTSDGRVVFISDRDGSPKLYSMKPDGTDIHLIGDGVLEEGGDTTGLNLSPDGLKAAFISQKNRDGIYPTDELFVLDLGNGSITSITNDGLSKAFPLWLSDNLNVVYLAGGPEGEFNDVSIANTVTGQIQIIANSQSIAQGIGSELGVSIHGISISPNKQQLILGVQSSLPDPHNILVAMNIDGTNIHQVTSNTESSFTPSWSVDSNIVYYGCGFQGYHEICRLNLSTSETQILTNIRNSLPGERKHYITKINISPDNEAIFQLQSSKAIYLLHLDNGAINRITEDNSFNNIFIGWIDNPVDILTPTFTPTATDTLVNIPTDTPTVTDTATNTSTPSNTPTFTFTPTDTSTSTETYTPTPSATYTFAPTITPTPTSGGATFPSTNVLDSFNRSNGALGTNWSGDIGGYQIISNQVDVIGGGSIFWSANSFAPDQEVYVTLTQVDTNADEIDLLLKSQSASNWNQGVLEVWYQPTQHIVQVVTYSTSQGWVQHGADISVQFANGDQFGARAKADGTVEVYKNNSLVGTVTVSNWSFMSGGGWIGIWTINSGNAVLEDFGGGTLGNVVTPTPTVTLTPTPTATSSGTSNTLDNFNRSNGSLGSNWSGDVGGYQITSNQVDVIGGGSIFWNANSFGADQEVQITLTQIDANADEIDLLLKSQSPSNWNQGVLEASYLPTQHIVQVVTYAQSQGWVQHGTNISVQYADGDRFGARAKADGTVEVYRNDTLIGSVTVSNWPYTSGSGWIGIWMSNAGSAVLEDFGGGTTP